MPLLHINNNETWINGVDFFYPVGAIYMSTNSTSPADMFGGTWAPLTDGRFLRPMGSYNQLGGSSTHQHWETVGFNSGESAFYIASGVPYTTSRVVTGSKIAFSVKQLKINNVNYNTFLESIKSTDSSRQNKTYAESTLPLYRTIYCWQRTA